MATQTYVALATTTLSSSASSVIFSSIPQDYRDLVIVVDVATGGSLVLARFKFNNDAVTEVEWVTMSGDGSSTTSGAFGGATEFQTFAATTSRILHTLQLMDYSATDKQKTGLHRGNAATGQVRASAMRWISTSAISQIEVASFANQFQSGSTFYLYGIEA